MGPQDNEFFEEYKRLEHLCSDMYSCKNGVSQYIEDMESRSPRETSLISSWYTDYKLLKHLRWIRNRIAHPENIVAPFRALWSSQRFPANPDLTLFSLIFLSLLPKI